MAKPAKATPAAKNDAVKADVETLEDAGKSAIDTGSDPSATTTITASEEQTGGGGDPAVSTQVPSEIATENPDGGSNDTEPSPTATVEGVDQVDTNAIDAQEPATVATDDAHEASAQVTDPSHEVICRGRAVGGPRRRAGLAFDDNLRPLTRVDLGGSDEAIKKTLEVLVRDPRLSLLPPTD